MSTSEKLSLEKVAEILELKAVTVKRYAREGLLDGEEHQGNWVFESEKVMKFKELQSKLR
ncbi:MAG: DNA-binding protein [Thalassobium sp.]|uniref:Helix-turn-helix domain-containing protein n=1 Tax=Thalassolituus pacificus TaxID=2975440 RepID=A0A9X3AHA8_9GAMM|nr:helix-turn-helix domain-containing protein [Thalassolituus pacificus]MCT7359792.1 helix-turn-helix domain-containing protein [Thalassolituus pacificus]PHS66524.1 MAG: DNA-binding protein [Thalassobium sp.]